MGNTASADRGAAANATEEGVNEEATAADVLVPSSTGNIPFVANRGRRVRVKREESDEDKVTVVEQNRNKRSKKSPADDLICPITLDLPTEPVTAEDGRVYEKSAIEKHIRYQTTHNGGLIRSPISNELMGANLVPSPQHRSMIESFIELGAIEGDLVTAWNKNIKEAKERKELQRKAESGDTEAMFSLGIRLRKGSNGFTTNPKLAFEWLTKAHDAGNYKATAQIGSDYMTGFSVPRRCDKKGIMYLTMAASQGSDFAACVLGDRLATGNGIPQNKKEAIRWLRQGLSPTACRRCSQAFKEKAQAKLDELLNGDDAAASVDVAANVAP